MAAAAVATALIALTFKTTVEGDGVGYFSYLHSMWVDHDLDLADEYAAALGAHANVIGWFLQTRTATGRLADFFPIGPAVLASPAYLAALALRPDGRPLFGPPFTTAFDLASLLYGLLALAIAYRVATSVTGDRRAAAVGTAAIALATPYAYYLVYEPSYSHTFSAFAVGLFVLAWLRPPGRRSPAGWFVLGVLGGAMGCVRFQDGPLAAIALLDVRAGRWRVAWFAVGLLVGFAPQLVVDHVIFGTWLPQRPAGQDLQLLPGHYLEVLFSSHHGLFAWTPVALAAVIGGLVAGGGRWRIAFAFALAVEIAIDGAAPDWWGGFAFGARRFLDLSPFFAVGIAEMARRVGPRTAAAALTLLAAWNVLLVANLTYVERGDVDPGYLGLVTGQLAAVPHLPNLLAQGAAGRDLLWWPLLHQPPHVLEGLVLTALIAICVAAALALAQVAPPRRV